MWLRGDSGDLVGKGHSLTFGYLIHAPRPIRQASYHHFTDAKKRRSADNISSESVKLSEDHLLLLSLHPLAEWVQQLQRHTRGLQHYWQRNGRRHTRKQLPGYAHCLRSRCLGRPSYVCEAAGVIGMRSGSTCLQLTLWLVRQDIRPYCQNERIKL